jgi:membrane-associated phospholipid phosphatase
MPGRPLLAHRGAILAVIAAAVLATVGLGVRYRGSRRAGRLDSAIDRRVKHHFAGSLGATRHLIDVADPASVVFICAILCLLFVVVRRRRLAALVVLGPALAGGLVDTVLKPVFDRRLDGALSFPSGHTAGAVAVAVVVVVAVLGASPPPWPLSVRLLVALAALGAAATVAAALVGAGYHYATDTAGGLCVAVACVLGAALGIDAVADRRYRRPQVDVRPASNTRLPKVEA